MVFVLSLTKIESGGRNGLLNFSYYLRVTKKQLLKKLPATINVNNIKLAGRERFAVLSNRSAAEGANAP